eukprot:6359983-Amphidinium_carterae.1
MRSCWLEAMRSPDAGSRQDFCSALRLLAMEYLQCGCQCLNKEVHWHELIFSIHPPCTRQTLHARRRSVHTDARLCPMLHMVGM